MTLSHEAETLKQAHIRAVNGLSPYSIKTFNTDDDLVAWLASDEYQNGKVLSLSTLSFSMPRPDKSFYVWKVVFQA